MNINWLAFQVYMRLEGHKHGTGNFAAVLKYLIDNWDNTLTPLFKANKVWMPSNDYYRYLRDNDIILGKTEPKVVWKQLFSKISKREAALWIQDTLSDAAWGSFSNQLDLLTPSEQMNIATKMPAVFVAMFSRRNAHYQSPKKLSKKALRVAIQKAAISRPERRILFESLQRFQEDGQSFLP